jgi:hypothetical protein
MHYALGHFLVRLGPSISYHALAAAATLHGIRVNAADRLISSAWRRRRRS